MLDFETIKQSKAQKLRYTADELLKLKKEQFNLRFQAASGQLENTARVRQVRRDIARIKTIDQVKRGEADSVASKG